MLLPAWWGGKPCALDLAVSSGLTEAGLALTACDADATARLYEQHKRRYKATEAQCIAAGHGFAPFVLEADGGLGPSALSSTPNDRKSWTMCAA